MTDPKFDPRQKPPPSAPAQDRVRLVQLLGRMLAEEWLARQQPSASPAPRSRVR